MNRVTEGLAAGAAGTTLLNAVTYLDMAARARPASSVPEQDVDEMVKRAASRSARVRARRTAARRSVR